MFLIRRSGPLALNPAMGNPAGYRVAIGAGDPWHCTGAIAFRSKATVCADKQAGERNTMIVSIETDHTTVSVNGQEVDEFVGDLSAAHPGDWRAGSIGLENLDAGSTVYFREITFTSSFR